jgi:extracellular factor (EF) 3-hydroxypalmitic acid methyl ester biosynthesis protein
MEFIPFPTQSPPEDGLPRPSRNVTARPRKAILPDKDSTLVIGPYFTAKNDAQPALPPAELCTIARETGWRLVADLERARSLSSDWANDAIGFALVCGALDRCLAQLAATACWGKENQLPSGEFWAVAGDWLGVGWLQHRARFKPRGYAGDYEMFERFWRRQCVDHSPGRLLDRYFQSQAAVEAVRARTEQLGAALVECCLTCDALRPFHVLSVGCGPAIDIACALEALPQTWRSQLRLTLLDLDEAALDHARLRLSTWLDASQITAVRENLYRLSDKPQSARLLDGADFLLCSGLFDYLPDPSAQKLLGQFWHRLAPGGTLLIGNFAPHNPTRAYMEWIGNWYLIYRTANELESLGQAAGLPRASFSIGAERFGIDLFLHGRK